MPEERTGALWVLGLLLLLYLPFAGCYGLWDPWESHYAEVARQMVQRGDWISLWWPGSPQDPQTFWSKPVLSFWLMAGSLRLFGLGRPGAVGAAEMVTGWRVEWALRLPFVLLGTAAALAVYGLVRRLAGRGAACLCALCLATASQWALISRQAMTDMAFCAPMTGALAFGGLALLLPDEEVRAPLRRRRLLGLSLPDDRACYGLLVLLSLCVVPQLALFTAQLGPFPLLLAGRRFRVHGALGVLPFWGLYAAACVWLCRARDRRSLYLCAAYLLCGLATLAKGPAGLALPLAVLVLLGLLREGPRCLLRLELLRGGLVFIATAAPWYAVMVLRHGLPFWREFIGDHYLRRAQGRHGDRGTFEYYLRQLPRGLFPWTGVVAGALACTGRWLRGPRTGLVTLCLLWLAVDLFVVSVVNTKFHHYILPALPALCILAGLLLDEVLAGAEAPRDGALGILCLGLPLSWLAGRDLAVFPARIGWLFNYDYVSSPGSGRPWPAPALYGVRYEYGAAVFTFAAAAAAALLWLAWAAWAKRPGGPAPRPFRPRLLLLGLLLGAGLAVGPSPELVAQFSSSKPPLGTAVPARLRLGWLVPAAAAALWLLPLALRRGPRAPWGLALLAVLWSGWLLDHFLVELSPHWSQKHVLSAYFRLRRGPEEPVVVWNMYWRGENFYTRNEIHDHRLPPAERTVFLGESSGERLRSYLLSHRGRRVFFVLERHRLELLRALLPAEVQQRLTVVDESNNKVYLAVADL